MGFVSTRESIPKSISHSGVILGRLFGKTSGNSLIMGTISMGGILESESLTLTIWYKNPLEVIFKAFN